MRGLELEIGQGGDGPRWDLLVKPSYSFTVFLFCSFFPLGSCKICLPPSKKTEDFLFYLSMFEWILDL